MPKWYDKPTKLLSIEKDIDIVGYPNYKNKGIKTFP